MARAYGSRAQLALAYETTYGVSPGGGFVQLPFASAQIGAEQNLIGNELLGFGRDPLAPTQGIITCDGDIVVPVDAEGVGYWLKGLLGAPSTTGTGPYTHVFTSGATSLPSISFEVGMPEVPAYTMHTGVRINSLSIDMQSGDDNLQATIGYVGQNAATASTTGAGTPAAIAVNRFVHFSGAIRRNGTDLGNVSSASVSYENNLEPVRTIRGDGLIEGVDPTIAALSGQIEARFADTVLLDQAANGSPCELVFSWSLAGGETLSITAHEAYLPRPKFSIDGPGGVMANFDWQAALDSTVGRMLTVSLTNNTGTY